MSTKSLIRRIERLPAWVTPVVVAAGTSVLGYVIARRFVSPRCDRALAPGVMPPAVVFDAKGRAILQVQGPCDPVWPVVTKNSRVGEVAYRDVNGTIHGNASRRFGTSRDSRHHAGIDLYGYHRDPIVAIDDGTIVAIQSFNLGTPAVLVEHDSGFVALYGELEPGSTQKLGLGKGSRVRAGQKIAEIGCMITDSEGKCDSQMLHFETYRSGTRQNQKWYKGSAAPPELLDPTDLLLRASSPRT